MNINYFISHSKETKENIAIPIVQILLNLGFDVWIDRKEIASGGYIYQDIKEAIYSSEYCIAIIDSFYLSRAWTLKELNLFYQRELTEHKNLIIPIYIGIEKETVYKQFSWLEGRAFEEISNDKFDIHVCVDTICRIVGRYYSDKITESIENIFNHIKNFSFPCKETIMILINDKEYYSTDFRTAIIEFSNIGGLLHGIYISMSQNQTPNFDLETSFRFCNLLRNICFNAQYKLTYNMYIAILKSVTIAAKELKILLDSI